jgi:prephenate dehydratase
VIGQQGERTGTEASVLRVAFQGEHGAFSEEAAFQAFGERVEPQSCHDFVRLVEAVSNGRAHFGVIPVENTLAGSVAPAYDALTSGEVEIVGQVIRPIRLHLMGPPGAVLPDLRKVLSHPMALGQCGRFLSGLPGVEAVAVYDTAGAALEVARAGDPALAAVAPLGAAARYGLDILASEIQDRSDNQTRFYLIRSPAPDRPSPPLPSRGEGSRYQTVLVCELPDRPGSLHGALGSFARQGIDLSKLESRPAPAPWTYRFIFEVRGHRQSPSMERALDELASRASLLRVLGSFPVGEAPTVKRT